MSPLSGSVTPPPPDAATTESPQVKAVTTGSRKPTIFLGDIAASQDLKESHDTDSGYGTASGTPKSLEKPPCTDSRFERSSLTGRLLKLPPKYGQLRDFDQAVPGETLDQFKSIAGSLQNALVQYMRKHFNAHEPMSMRLMVLGRSAENAKPWIVVFCHESRKSRTQRFFKKSYARGLCQTKAPATLPFEVLVVGHALQLTAGSDIHVGTDYSFATKTLSGLPVHLTQTKQLQRATMGGLIKITISEGNYGIYGLTAGHLLGPSFDQQHETLTDDVDSTDASSDVLSSEGESESDCADDDANEAVMQVRKTAPIVYNMTEFGHVVDPLFLSPLDRDFSTGAHDWALIKINQVADLKPNLLRGGSHRPRREAELLVSKGDTGPSSAQDVVLNSCTKDTQMGTLNYLPCAIWLGHRSGGFVDALSLTMSNNTGRFAMLWFLNVGCELIRI